MALFSLSGCSGEADEFACAALLAAAPAPAPAAPPPAAAAPASAADDGAGAPGVFELTLTPQDYFMEVSLAHATDGLGAQCAC